MPETATDAPSPRPTDSGEPVGPGLLPRIRRAEAAETRAFAALLRGTPRAAADALGVFVDEVAGATLLGCAGDDGLLFNRVIGLGVDALATDDVLDRVLGAYRERGVRRFFVHLAPGAAPADLPSMLADRGLPPYRRAWVQLDRDADPVLPEAPRGTELRVRPATPADATAFGGLLHRGFDLPSAAAAIWNGALTDRSGRFAAFLALDGDTAVAAAAMYLDDADPGHLHAHLTGAATDPAHRGRGAQGLLLRARITQAIAAGAQSLSSETGEAVPGDAQHSYRNLVRHGFRPLVVRPNHAPAGTRWDHGTKRPTRTPGAPR